MFDRTKLAFDSTVNYMKRSNDFSSSTPLTLPAVFGTVSYPVTHNLNYIPYFDVFCDFDGDGIIWAGEKIDQYTETSLSGNYPASPTLNYWSTTSVLTMVLDNSTSPAASGIRTIYWIVYLDFGSVT